MTIFFRTKAQEEPGFELTKPSTGQEYKKQEHHTTSAKRYKGAARTAYNTTPTTSKQKINYEELLVEDKPTTARHQNDYE